MQQQRRNPRSSNTIHATRPKARPRKAGKQNQRTLYNASTDPALPIITRPIPSYHLSALQQPQQRSFAGNMQAFVSGLMRRIVVLINFALALLLMLLFTRFVLTAFALHNSLFSIWTFRLSDPFMLPFNNLLPALPYQGFSIDTNNLIAILAYTIAFKLFTAFLHTLTGPTQKVQYPRR